MPESIIDYAMRVQDKRNQAREMVLEVLAEADLEPDARRRVMEALRRAKVI